MFVPALFEFTPKRLSFYQSAFGWNFNRLTQKRLWPVNPQKMRNDDRIYLTHLIKAGGYCNGVLKSRQRPLFVDN